MKYKELSLIKLVPWLAISVLGLFWLFLVNEYSVEILFHDQWALYIPMFNEEGPGSAFLFQHGPHRQGLGGVLTYYLALSTGFSVVAESRMIVLFLVVASVLALNLKIRMTGNSSWWDTSIPLLFLNPVQIETVVDVPNLSHSVLPLVFTLSIARCWLSNRRLLRFGLGSVIASLSLFTGFGIFVFVGFVILLLLDVFASPKVFCKRYLTVLFLTGFVLIVAVIVFSVGYKTGTKELGATFQRATLPDYLTFVCSLYGRFFYFTHSIRPYFGFLVVVSLAYVTFRVMREILVKQVRSTFCEILLFLMVVSLVFAVGAAIGRISFGPFAGGSSRYTTLAIPAIYATYLWLSQRKNMSHSGMIFISIHSIAVLSSFFSSVVYAIDRSEPRSEGKRAWIESYRKNGDATLATSESGFKIFPEPDLIVDRIEYLELNKLGSFNN